MHAKAVDDAEHLGQNRSALARPSPITGGLRVTTKRSEIIAGEAKGTGAFVGEARVVGHAAPLDSADTVSGVTRN